MSNNLAPLVMTKFLLTFGIICLTCHFSLAQLKWGVRTGVQTSFLHSDVEKGDNRWKPSYLVPSFFLERSLNSTLSLSGELSVTNKGFRWNDNTYNFKSSYPFAGHSYHLGYVSLPILLNFTGRFRSAIFLGPEFDYKYSSHVFRNEELVADHEIFTRKFDVGITAGVSLKLSPSHFLNIRYTRGFINVVNPDADVYTVQGLSSARDANLKFYNQSLQFALSSTFSVDESDKKTVTSVGIRQGIVSSQLFGSGVYDYNSYGFELENRIGFSTALEARFQLYKYLFTTAGLEYSEQGGKDGYSLTRINYLCLPLTAGISPVKTKYLTLSIEGGVIVNKQLSAATPYDENREDFNFNNRKLITSFVYGFELSTDAPKHFTLLLSYRKTHVNNSFLEMESKNNSDHYEFFTKTESFTFGVLVPLKKIVKAASGNKSVSTEDGVKVTTHDAAKTESGEPVANPSSFGFAAGLNFQRIAYNHPPPGIANNDGVNPMIHLGLYWKVKISDRLSFIPELRFLPRHYRVIESPLALSFFINRRFNIEGGFQWAILKGEHFETTAGYESSIEKPVDLGWLAGIRYKASRKMSLALRYFRGTVDVQSWYDLNGFGLRTEGFSRAIQFSTYYNLSRKGW
jgi:hypothetical protein